MLELAMLPAREGDCLILTWGDDARRHRLLVDGGRKATFGAAKAYVDTLPEADRAFELLVVTHVDRDHIEGVLEWLSPAAPLTFNDVWFNGYQHLHREDVEVLGAVQGEKLTERLEGSPTWNAAFERKSVEVGRPAVTLPGGLTLEVLGPTRAKLEALIPRWEKECRDAGLVPGRRAQRPPPPPGVEVMGRLDIDTLAKTPFVDDTEAPNGSSIVLLATHGHHSILLTGDAHGTSLVDAIEPRAKAAGGRLPLSALKVSHHGSEGNTPTELLDLLSCPRYLVSTNGSYFDHPRPVAVSRIIKHGGPSPELIFNYRSLETSLFDNDRWRAKHGYRTTYPIENGWQTVPL